MKVNCQHGFYKFIEEFPGDVSRFVSTYGFDMFFENGYFTFEFLLNAPKYSLKGGTYLGAPATVTIEGEPWEILKANGLIYDFNEDEVIPISTVTQLFKLEQASSYWMASGLILPGSITDDGERVTDYAAFFDDGIFKYSEVTFV